MSRALPSVPLCVCWLQAPGHLQRCCLDFTRWDAARQGVPAPGRVRQPSRQPTFLSQGGCGLSRPWRTSTDTRTHEPPVHAHAAHTTAWLPALTHTHAHSYMLTLTRRLPHMLAHAHTLTHQGKHMGSHTGLYTHRLTQTRAHSMLAHTQIPSHTRTHTHMLTHRLTHACTHMLTHSLAHRLTPTPGRASRCARACQPHGSVRFLRAFPGSAAQRDFVKPARQPGSVPTAVTGRVLAAAPTSLPGRITCPAPPSRVGRIATPPPERGRHL